MRRSNHYCAHESVANVSRARGQAWSSAVPLDGLVRGRAKSVRLAPGRPRNQLLGLVPGTSNAAGRRLSKLVTMYRRYGKRPFDLLVGSALLVLALPVMAVVALALVVTQGRPILFRQVRPGLGGRPFTILKFRTMQRGEGADHDRITAVGALLRRSSLDELPSILNVIKGDMSLVGPRPLLMQYLPLYTEEQARRHEVRPGLTGWAQLHGRNALAWPDKFRYDVWYVDNVSFLVDVRILLGSVSLVLRGSGVQQPGHATTEYFRGDVQ